jgi:hypothetical protein
MHRVRRPVCQWEKRHYAANVDFATGDHIMSGNHQILAANDGASMSFVMVYIHIAKGF